MVFSWSSTKIAPSVALLLALQRPRRFDNTSSIFENTVASKFSCEALRHTAFSVSFRASWQKFWIPQRVALVPGVCDEVLGQVMFRDVELDKAHQVPAPLVQFVQGLQATESNRIEHVEQESQIPSLVKDFSVDTLKTHCTRQYCASVTLHICNSVLSHTFLKCVVWHFCPAGSQHGHEALQASTRSGKPVSTREAHDGLELPARIGAERGEATSPQQTTCAWGVWCPTSSA